MTDGWTAPRVRQAGAFEVDLPPADAFKLFTAAGERLWVPGWAPDILGSLPQHAGLVFTTGSGPEHTIWTVVDTDPARGFVRYSRVTPGARAGTVTVQVAQAGAGSRVEVAYDLTALSTRGAESLEAYSPAGFAQMMADWHRLIADMLAGGRADLAALKV